MFHVRIDIQHALLVRGVYLVATQKPIEIWLDVIEWPQKCLASFHVATFIHCVNDDDDEWDIKIVRQPLQRLNNQFLELIVDG